MKVMHYDAIVVGSGITGGLAAKELTAKGLKVALIERGKNIPHRTGYKQEFTPPWELPFRGEGDKAAWNSDYAIQQGSGQMNEWNQEYWVKDSEHPYTSTSEPFTWYRGYHLGGRSLMWGRQCYRWSPEDFNANAKDGKATAWPIQYDDVAPWYSYVEKFIGISGSRDGLPVLPDGEFQPAIPLNPVETHLKSEFAKSFPGRHVIIGRTANLTEAQPELGRAPCQNRNICSRGCSFGAYYSTQSAALPTAQATGNLTLLTDSIVEQLNYDDDAKKLTGVTVIDRITKEKSVVNAKIVFVCAGAFNSVALMLRSKSKTFPNGIANSSGVLGKYIMDHAVALAAVGEIPGFEDIYYEGNRPTGILIPRFINVDQQETDVARGFVYQGGAYRPSWTRALNSPGLGVSFKEAMRQPGNWRFAMTCFAECLPNAENRITLDETQRDVDGLPALKIQFKFW